jgi:hypothetical protein
MNRLIVSSFIDELEKLGSLGFGKGIPLAVKSSLGKGHPPTSRDVIDAIKASLAQWRGGIEGQAAMAKGDRLREGALRSNIRVRFPDIKDTDRLLAVLREEGAVGLHGLAPASAFGRPLAVRRVAPKLSTTTETLPSTGFPAPSGPIKIREV